MILAETECKVSQIPGWKTVCTVVGVTYILLASMMLFSGFQQMADFGVPEVVLASPHAADFHHWLFVHMSVIGVLIVLLGRYVQSADAQRTVARVLTLVALHYTYLDLRTSEMFGIGLYAGLAWVVPTAVDVLFALTFAVMSFCKPLPRGQ